LVAATTGAADHISSLFMRAYEAVAGGLHERAVYSVTKAQAAVEAAAGGKVAAVAASAAAMAGGGYATVEHTVREARAHLPSKTAERVEHRISKRTAVTTSIASSSLSSPSSSRAKPVVASGAQRVNEFGEPRARATVSKKSEFGAVPRLRSVRAISAAVKAPVGQTTAPASGKVKVAPEFGSSRSVTEFSP